MEAATACRKALLDGKRGLVIDVEVRNARGLLGPSGIAQRVARGKRRGWPGLGGQHGLLALFVHATNQPSKRSLRRLVFDSVKPTPGFPPRGILGMVSRQVRQLEEGHPDFDPTMLVYFVGELAKYLSSMSGRVKIMYKGDEIVQRADELLQVGA